VISKRFERQIDRRSGREKMNAFFRQLSLAKSLNKKISLSPQH
jgi:hypothetical protein